MKSESAAAKGGVANGGVANGGSPDAGKTLSFSSALVWTRRNLFNSWGNSLITIVALWMIYEVVTSMMGWMFVHAAYQGGQEECRAVEGFCWPFIADTWELFMVGRYPYELRFRPLLVLLLILAVAAPAIFRAVRQSLWYYGAWVATGLVALIIIRGSDFLSLEVVDTGLWGGLMLTMILSVAGIVVSFPIGVVLALGRRSQSMPVMRALCVGYIELIRGVPLITILFMASNMLPLFFPSGFDLDKVLAAQIGIIMFSAAYMAEVVRGGLQAIPTGQIEAAEAVGLNYFQTMVFIVLPQALRIVIPPLVSTFIALLKDTSLVQIIGLFDLLGIHGPIIANPIWLAQGIEGYVFIGIIYWSICFTISRYARNLENRFKSAQH